MAPPPQGAHIEALRSFNRFYTRRIGALDEGLLNTRYTLPQGRGLFELGQRRAATAGGWSLRAGKAKGRIGGRACRCARTGPGLPQPHRAGVPLRGTRLTQEIR